MMRSPRSLLTACVCASAALGWPLTAAQRELPVTISSLDGGFVSKAYFRGYVLRFPDSLVAVFDSTLIRQAAGTAGRGAMHIDSVSVGLAAATGRGWSVYQPSEAVHVADSLAERAEFTLGRHRFVLRTPADSLLERSWVVVTIYQVNPAIPRSEQGTAYTYAHSARGLFASPR